MRVSVLGFNNSWGGTRTAYREFLSMLLENGVETAGISIADADEWVPEGLSFHDRVAFSRQSLGLKKGPQTLFAIAHCKAFRPNIFVSVGLSRVGNAISRSLGRRTFSICQDVIFGRQPTEPAFIAAQRSFDAIAPQTPSMEAELRRNGFMGGQMKWLPCFAEKPIAGLRAEPGARRPFRLAYFGRLEPHKGLDLLIEAYTAEGLSDRMIIDIWGAGDGDRYRALSTRLAVSGSVRVMGPYPSGEAGAKLMASYDSLALTTLGNEGLPLVLLEAMAYGLPLLTTTVASIPDCCINNPDAVMVEPTSEGVRGGLRQIVDRLGQGSFSASRHQDFYEERFSHTPMTQRWLECIADPAKFFNA